MAARLTAAALALALPTLSAPPAPPEPSAFPAPAGQRRPFAFGLAGALFLADDPLQGSFAQLAADHFSYVGAYLVNGCANNAQPYSCASNGCNWPGMASPDPEIGGFEGVAAFASAARAASLFVGAWGVTYSNVEAEAACMAESLAALRSAHDTTLDFFIVDGEKSFETVQNQSQRFVGVFNARLPYWLARAYTPECHTAVPMAPWLEGGFNAIMPMAYWDLDGVNPSYCLRWLLSNGVPANVAKVMFDGFSHGNPPHSWADYFSDYASVNNSAIRGFSVWRTLHAAEWDEFKALLEATPIATW